MSSPILSSPYTMLNGRFYRCDRGIESHIRTGDFWHSSTGHFHSKSAKAVNARAKRVQVKKEKLNSGESPSSTPIKGNKLNRQSEPGQSTLNQDRFSVDQLKRNKESIDMVDDVSLMSNETSVSAQRVVILRACVATCAGISATGLFIQQVSHLLAEAGWSVPDSTLLLKFNFEPWDLGVTIGLVIAVSLSRQLLLQVWQEFSESSNAANKEILSPLKIRDYAVIAVLPGISEELLFRGALLPCFGLNWKGAMLSGIIFGVLHLSGGRKLAFSIWASLVGIFYGLACVSTQRVVVPMAAHSLNNLVAAILWKLKQGDAD